jgi:hypothetical protein
VPAAAAPAPGASSSAVPNSARPTLPNWGVWKSCGTAYPGQNCAEILATAEDPGSHTLYAAGDFTAAIDHTGSSSLPYDDLVAINETTGTVMSSFRPHTFNGPIDTVAVDRATHRVYVGGSFTKVNRSGLHAQHAAAFDATTGKLLGFNLRADRPVKALLPAGGIVYVGGQFITAGGAARGALAAVDAITGTALPTFVPPAIGWSGTNLADVRSLAFGDYPAGALALYVGGHFDTVDGRPHLSVIRVNPVTGALDPSFDPVVDAVPGDPLQAADGMVWVDGSDSGPAGIVVAQAGHFNRAYRFNTFGRRIWYLTPDGDMQAVAVSGTTAYFGGHFQCVATGPAYCSNGQGVPRVHLAAVDLGSGTVDANFTPKMSPSNAPYFFGVWSVEITANGTLWAGGVFTQVNDNGTTYRRPKLAAFPSL